MSDVVLITGTSSGFGLRTSIELAKRGYVVIATLRNERKKPILQKEARRHAVEKRIHIFVMDVTRSDQIQQTIRKAVERHGPIDILINNAGYAQGGFVEEVSVDAYKKQMETNFFGLVKTTQAVLPMMRKRRQGRIINISSVSGRIGFPGMSAYAASKFAVEGFSESLRLEMRPYNVHVVLIEPGAFRTAIWEKGLQSLSDMTTPETSYAAWKERLTQAVRKNVHEAEDAQSVIQTIASVLKKRSPALRYPVGKRTQRSLVFKNMLPWRWIENIILKK